MRILRLFITFGLIWLAWTNRTAIVAFAEREFPGAISTAKTFVADSIAGAKAGLGDAMSGSGDLFGLIPQGGSDAAAEASITPGPLWVPISANASGTLSIQAIIEETNLARAREGLMPLRENVMLSQSSAIKARDMLDRQYFEHESPDGVGVGDLAARVGYEYVLVGENLATGPFRSGADVVGAWMDSPGHRANILQARYTEIGVGLYQGSFQGNRVWMAVQHFGQPKSACPRIDENLGNRIASLRSEAAVLNADIIRLRASIDQGREESGQSGIAALIETYNRAAARYNELSRTIRDSVDAYNRQVRAFNACAQPE